MNHLHADVVMQVHNDGSHQIRGWNLPLSRTNHCRAKNIVTDDGCPLGRKAHFPNFVLRELQSKTLVDRENRQKNETEAAAVQALKEHQRFEPWLFQKNEAAMIFESG